MANMEASVYPRKLVAPIGAYFRDQLKLLRLRRRRIVEEDPFRDISRAGDNAAPDIEADEQFGHDRVSAMRLQLDRKIIQTRRALARVKIGSYGTCESCGRMIDTDRLMIYPETSLCINCTRKREKRGRE